MLVKNMLFPKTLNQFLLPKPNTVAAYATSPISSPFRPLKQETYFLVSHTDAK